MAANITIADGAITIKQGTSVSWAYVLKQDAALIDITGYTARCQVRASFDTKALITLSSDSGITNGGADGTFTLTISPATSSAVVFKGETLEGVYDVEVTNTATGEVTRIAEGTFTISREVTRA